VARTLFCGDDSCSGAGLSLKEAVRDFNATLAVVGHNIGFMTFDELRGLPGLVTIF